MIAPQCPLCKKIVVNLPNERVFCNSENCPFRLEIFHIKQFEKISLAMYSELNSAFILISSISKPAIDNARKCIDLYLTDSEIRDIYHSAITTMKSEYSLLE